MIRTRGMKNAGKNWKEQRLAYDRNRRRMAVKGLHSSRDHKAKRRQEVLSPQIYLYITLSKICIQSTGKTEDKNTINGMKME